MKSMLPTIMYCLSYVHNQKKGPPKAIHVTGHSLGAALAVHFTSAVKLGKTYGYKSEGTYMPKEILAGHGAP